MKWYPGVSDSSGGFSSHPDKFEIFRSKKYGFKLFLNVKSASAENDWQIWMQF